MEKVKVAFLGGKPLGVQCLELLLERPDVEVIAVVCRPRDARGWWHTEGEKRVIDVVEEHGLNRVNEVQLLNHEVDMAFSILFYNIISQPLIDHCNGRIVNLHPAPLPDYRGSNSYSHAIINGETLYSVTLHLIDKGVDTGPIIKVRSFDIEPNMTARELHDKASLHALQLFEEQLSDLLAGDFDVTSQEKTIQDTGKSARSYKKSSLSALKQIDPSDFSQRPCYVESVVRGLDFRPFEPAYTILCGKKVYLSTSR